MRFDALQQWKAAKLSLAFYKNYFPDLKYPLAGLAAFLLLALFTRTKPSPAETWFLVWPFTSLLVYALFTTEVRYVAPWLVLFWVAACSALWARPRLAERLLLILLALLILTPRLIELRKAAPALAKPRATSMDVQVAQELHDYSIRPGNPIAIVGTGFDHYYARIARARIVAQVTNPRDFWSYSSTSAVDVERALAEAGAKALVARFRPARFQMGDWHVVPGSSYSFLVLDRIPD